MRMRSVLRWGIRHARQLSPASAVCAQAHDPSVAVHCVVHCLGHCSSTLFMSYCFKKKYKIDPRVLGLHSVVSEPRHATT